MNKYNKGKVYKITSDNTTDVYIGSTTKELSQRLSGHKNAYKRFADNKTNYCLSFELVKHAHFEITLVEAVNVETKEELLKREGFHSMNTPNCINKKIAGRTMKEYYDANKAEILEYHKTYYAENKTEILETHKKYRTENKDKIVESKKEWFIANRDQVLEKNKAYREENKEDLQLKQKEICECECGLQYSRSNKSQHYKSALHKNKLELIKNGGTGNEIIIKEKVPRPPRAQILCECGNYYRKDIKSKHLMSLKHQKYLETRVPITP